jgi:HAD superfamily hydrolase (TIGR01509 family)
MWKRRARPDEISGPLTAVIFDVDGTLVDSVDLHAECWRQALARFGKKVAFEAVRSQIGKGGDQLLPVFLDRKELKSFGKELEEYRTAQWKSEYLGQVRAFPMVRELVERLLEDGKKIALASSAKADELAIYEQIARIDDLVPATTSADDAKKSKPHPDVFQAALAKLGKPDRARVLVVGDTPWDADGAARAGLRSIGVLCGGFAPEDLVSAGCIDLYWDPEDLLAHYDVSPLTREDLVVETAHMGP